jgi:hypothetical protein
MFKPMIPRILILRTLHVIPETNPRLFLQVKCCIDLVSHCHRATGGYLLQTKTFRSLVSRNTKQKNRSVGRLTNALDGY